LAGYFLERYVYGVRHQGLPAARRRLAERFPVADGGGTNAASEG